MVCTRHGNPVDVVWDAKRHRHRLRWTLAVFAMVTLWTGGVNGEAIDPFWITQDGTSESDAAYGLAISGDMLYVGGYTAGTLDANNPNAGLNDGFIAQFDSNGVQQWVTQVGSDVNDRVEAVATDAQGRIYIAGATSGLIPVPSGAPPNVSAGGTDSFVAQVDASGAVQWVRQFGTTSSDSAFHMVADSSGNTYVTGYTVGNLDGASTAGSLDAFVRKYSANGIELWTTRIGEVSSGERGHGVAVGNNGEIYLAGYTNGYLATESGSNIGGHDGFLTKLDADTGLEDWTRQFGSIEGATDSAYEVAVDSLGNAYVSGYTGGNLFTGAGNNDGSVDAFLIKYDSFGNPAWTQPVQFGNTNQDVAVDLAIDRNDVIHVFGYTDDGLDPTTTVGGKDLFVSRYTTAGTFLSIQQWGSTTKDIARAIAISDAGEVFVAGRTDGALPNNTSAGGSDFFVAQVPEPSTYALLLLGATCVVWTRSRRGYARSP